MGKSGKSSGININLSDGPWTALAIIASVIIVSSFLIYGFATGDWKAILDFGETVAIIVLISIILAFFVYIYANNR